jgi:antiphage defense system Thoeris ThsB-like protein
MGRQAVLVARYVYYAFHYQRDIQRANVVRNSRTVLAAGTEVGYYDQSLWEEAQTKGDAAIKKLIDEGMVGSSVTVVLIGAETYSRPWVQYEIAQSHNLGKGLLGIRLNNIADWSGNTESAGPNPFDFVTIDQGLFGHSALSTIYPVYDWVLNDGYNNAAGWIDAAAIAAGR